MFMTLSSQGTRKGKRIKEKNSICTLKKAKKKPTEKNSFIIIWIIICRSCVENVWDPQSSVITGCKIYISELSNFTCYFKWQKTSSYRIFSHNWEVPFHLLHILFKLWRPCGNEYMKEETISNLHDAIYIFLGRRDEN